MLIRKRLCSIVGIIALLAAGCAPSQPMSGTNVGSPAPATAPAVDSATALTQPSKGTTSVQSTHLRPDALATLLDYIPISVVDYHPANVLGPTIHFVDFARMREDLGLAPVTGASSRQDKLPLIRNLSTQSLSVGLDNLTGSSFFAEWGWDFADLDQTLALSGDGLAILLGDFSRPEVRAAFAKKGYTQKESQGFAIFTGDDKLPAFALKGNTLIVAAGKDKSLAEQMVLFGTQHQQKLSTHPTIAQLLPRLDGAWGALLAPSGDYEAMAEQLHYALSQLSDNVRGTLYEKYKLDDPVKIGWDFMAIGFWGKSGEPTTLRYIYHYPSVAEAQRDIDLVRQTLTEAPSYSGRSKKWSDLVSLQSVTVEGSLVQATATTNSTGLIGNSLGNRDWTFMPVRVGDAAK